MAIGTLFTLMINDGKEDRLLNATETLQKKIDKAYQERMNKCMAGMKAYFENPVNKKDKGYEQERALWEEDPVDYCANKSNAVYSMMLEITKTHRMFIGNCYKPFVAMAFSYIKTSEKHGSTNFANTIDFIVPQIGSWVGDMVLHLTVSGLSAVSSKDKVKYCAFLGHRLVERVALVLDDIEIAYYTSELYNKHFQYHVPVNKKTGWMRNVGQEVPHQAFMTSDPLNDEFREYKWFGDGPQTFKRTQSPVDMYIPLLFWFNTDISAAFPNIKIPKGKFKIRVQFCPLDKIISIADYGGGGKYNEPTISTADLYIQHINTLPDIENMILNDYDFNLIRVPKIMEKELNNPSDAILLKEIKYQVEHIALCFRPMSNYNDVDNWYRNVVLKAVDLYVPAAVMDYTQVPPAPTIAINRATYYTQIDVIDTCALKINDVEIFQEDTIKKYSSFYPYTTIGINTPDDQGWLLLNNQIRPDMYDPSGHINMSKNREVYFKYSSSWINDAQRAKLTVIAQCINFLIIYNGKPILKYM